MMDRKSMVLIRLLALALLVSSAIPRVASAAPNSKYVLATSCYGGADRISRSFPTAYAWTGWYYRTTTTRCADLNVKVSDIGCRVWVDAQYYSSSRQQWIDGAYDDAWLTPGQWYVPITALRDNSQVRVRFYSSCTDSSSTIWLAF